MAEPDWNPDTGGRSLAEILREAGIESATRASRRKRWDDPDEAGLRQRRAEAAAEGSATRAGYSRRRSDLEAPEPARDVRGPGPREMRDPGERRAPREPARALREPRESREPRDMRRPKVDPSTAAIPGLRPDRKPGVPAAAVPAPETDRRSGGARVGDRRAADLLPQRSRTERTAREEAHPSTGPIPVVGDGELDADLDAGPRESALAWLRFAGELVIALAVGVGVYFAATLLWENLPYLAVLLAPLAVTGLVAGVGAWRHRMGRDPVGLRLLAVLVLAGTLLTIVPAAGLLAGP
ncbi:MAG TPA: hypothetical protein VGN47_10310 [Blastococcus sp.]|jgi:hypothetical protein|nr:hypothetical protein [Blastococcus sp.]